MADIPPIAAFGSILYDDTPKKYRLKENEQVVINLGDGRVLHISLDNPSTKKRRVLTEDQKQAQIVFGFAAFFLILIICIICSLLGWL